MKHKLLFFLSIITFTGIFGQYLPNGGFENWDTTFMFRDPQTWNSGNFQFSGSNYLTVDTTSDSYSGNLALKLKSASFQGDVIFGYIFANGILDQDTPMDTINYFGGFPITDAPDTLHGYFKYHIATMDTAIGLISFKKEGKIIGQNMMQLYGTENNFRKISFPILDMAEVPDTAMIAFACTNAFVDPVPGNWLIIDSLWFTGTTDSIPNCDFEVWDSFEYTRPSQWTSFNELLALNMLEESVTPSTDAHSGTYAARIESKLTVNPLSPQDTFSTGILLPANSNGSIFSQTENFPLSINPSSLKGFYKCVSAGNDTAGISVTLIDNSYQSYSYGAWLLPVGDYTAFEVPFNYPVGTVMTQVRIAITTNFKDQGNKGDIGSVLLIDDLELVNPCEGMPEFSIVNTTTNVCLPQVLDAGADWDTYIWSTGDDTRTIEVTLTGNYSVTVVDNNTGCYMSDIITATYEICDALKENINSTSTFEVYPVPATDIINISFVNMLPGGYKLEIISITGSKIKDGKVNLDSSNETVRLSVSDLSAGLYLIKISGENFSQIQKLNIK